MSPNPPQADSSFKPGDILPVTAAEEGAGRSSRLEQSAALRRQRESIFLATLTAKVTGGQPLHQISAALRSLVVIKRIALRAVLFLTIAFVISACASRDEEISERSSSPSAATVPGEKIPDEGAYAPGPVGSGGSIRW